MRYFDNPGGNIRLLRIIMYYVTTQISIYYEAKRLKLREFLHIRISLLESTRPTRNSFAHRSTYETCVRELKPSQLKGEGIKAFLKSI